MEWIDGLRLRGGWSSNHVDSQGGIRFGNGVGVGSSDDDDMFKGKIGKCLQNSGMWYLICLFIYFNKKTFNFTYGRVSLTLQPIATDYPHNEPFIHALHMVLYLPVEPLIHRIIFSSALEYIVDEHAFLPFF